MPTDEEKDEFWDLSRLLPKKKEKPLRRFSPDPALETVEVRGDSVLNGRENKLSFGKREEKLIEAVTYTPEDNPLILSVTVERRTATYSFYARFRAEGLRRLHFEADNAEYTPFFSYIPQYSQLNEAQAEYYYYFRSMTRKREKVRTDLAYLLLLIYEVLNLPDAVSPKEEGLPMLVFLWCSYRAEFPKIDKYLAEWVTDYCLLHHLSCPIKDLTSILPHVLSVATFKEFYLGNATELSPAGVDAVLSLASSYHWRHSRYAVGDNLAFYEKHTYPALLPVLRRLLPSEAETENSVKERVNEAFSGSLCSHNIRATLHVIYRPFSHTPRLQKILTQAVKHADNRIRALLSIKNRCSVTELPTEYRQLIDAYFNRIVKEGHTTPVREAYEALYDAADSGMSFGAASEIELHSWDTTRTLVPEEELSETESAVPTCEISEEKTAAVENATATLSSSALAFLSALLRFGGGGAKRVAAENFSTEDTLAEEINILFSDFFGDIILEPTENGYAVIEDYRDEVEKWIEKMN